MGTEAAMIVTAGSAALQSVNVTPSKEKSGDASEGMADDLMKAEMAAKTPMLMATAMPIFSAGLTWRWRRRSQGTMAKERSMIPE